MKLEELDLTIIKEGDQYIAFPQSIPGIIVQVDNIDDIPEQMSAISSNPVRLSVVMGRGWK